MIEYQEYAICDAGPNMGVKLEGAYVNTSIIQERYLLARNNTSVNTS